MHKKVNCKFNVGGAHCVCKDVKRSLFGIGARCCTEFYGRDDTCEYKKVHLQRPVYPPKGIS